MHIRERLYIDGKWVQPTGTGSIDVINPATEEIIGKIPVGSEKDIDKADSAARIAFESWSKSSIETRMEILNALSNTMTTIQQLHGLCHEALLHIAQLTICCDMKQVIQLFL